MNGKFFTEAQAVVMTAVNNVLSICLKADGSHKSGGLNLLEREEFVARAIARATLEEAFGGIVARMHERIIAVLSTPSEQEALLLTFEDIIRACRDARAICEAQARLRENEAREEQKKAGRAETRARLLKACDVLGVVVFDRERASNAQLMKGADGARLSLRERLVLAEETIERRAYVCERLGINVAGDNCAGDDLEALGDEALVRMVDAREKRAEALRFAISHWEQREMTRRSQEERAKISRMSLLPQDRREKNDKADRDARSAVERIVDGHVRAYEAKKRAEKAVTPTTPPVATATPTAPEAPVSVPETPVAQVADETPTEASSPALVKPKRPRGRKERKAAAQQAMAQAMAKANGAPANAQA